MSNLYIPQKESFFLFSQRLSTKSVALSSFGTVRITPHWIPINCTTPSKSFSSLRVIASIKYFLNNFFWKIFNSLLISLVIFFPFFPPNQKMYIYYTPTFQNPFGHFSQKSWEFFLKIKINFCDIILLCCLLS